MGRKVSPAEQRGVKDDFLIGRMLSEQPLADPRLAAAQERNFISIGALKLMATSDGVMPQLAVRHAKRLEGIRLDSHHSWAEGGLLLLIDSYIGRLTDIEINRVVELDDPLSEASHKVVKTVAKRFERTAGDVNFLLGVLEVYQDRWQYLTERARR